MADFNFKEIMVKAGNDAGKEAGKEAAAATSRAIKRIANPTKKPLPVTVPLKKPAPDWFKYGIYTVVGLVGVKLIQTVMD